MWEARDPRSIIDAAEKAAAAANYASAETLLREAARLQEASLGPLHPDVANTLNNLGVVCEITGKPADAEQFFRRAFDIATAALDPDHPFVATSRKNLRDFCEARGLQDPTPQSRVDAEADDPELESKRFFTRVAIGALGPIAMLMVILAAGLPRLGSKELVGVTQPTVATTGSAPDDASANRVTSLSAPALPVVVRASLCAALEDWLCDPADRPVPPGPLFFYTQVKSTSATTMQHRWYQDDRLHQAVDLRIQASAGVGYRAYSRTTMNSDSAGSWRVELRSEDGVLLHEEHFTVR
jgi:hypothetical protein